MLCQHKHKHRALGQSSERAEERWLVGPEEIEMDTFPRKWICAYIAAERNEPGHLKMIFKFDP